MVRTPRGCDTPPDTKSPITAKVAADGSCNPIHLEHASYDSYIYSGGAPTDVSCTASDPGAPTAGLVNPTTVCCAP